MTRRRIAFVGEAPPRGGAGGAFEGRSGERLAELCGLSHRDFLLEFDRDNVLSAWPGPSAGNGSAFPASAAREAAQKKGRTLGEKPHVCRVVIVGRRSAEAFGLAWKPFEWSPAPAWAGRSRWPWAQIPHPSGVNLWWNDPRNVDVARAFLLSVASLAAEYRADAELEDSLRGVLPR